MFADERMLARRGTGCSAQPVSVDALLSLVTWVTLDSYLTSVRLEICKAAQIETSRSDGAWSDLPHSSMLLEEVESVSIILAFPAEVLSDSHLSPSQC